MYIRNSIIHNRQVHVPQYLDIFDLNIARDSFFFFFIRLCVAYCIPIRFVQILSCSVAGIAFRYCEPNGTWYWHPAYGRQWTNYTNCVDMSDEPVSNVFRVQVLSTSRVRAKLYLYINYKCYLYINYTRCDTTFASHQRDRRQATCQSDSANDIIM